jgi:hypothetical protein
MAARQVAGRDYHYGPYPAGGSTKHEGSRASCLYPDCDMSNREVTEQVRAWLREHNASSIVQSVSTTWHNGCRRTSLYPVEGRVRELRALIEDQTIKSLSRVAEWHPHGHIEIYH